MESKPKSVGTFFKPVVIDPRLKELVNTILLASSPTSRSALAAKKRLRAMTKPATSYLYATEIQSYLDSKTLGGTENWVYPMVGDLFLDALEVNLSSLGPNFFRDHYSGAVWCYQHGRCPGKAVQGAFYCVDLAFRKTIELFLAKTEGDTAPKGVSLSFQSESDLDYRSMITVFLDMARQCVRDVIATASHTDKQTFGHAFMDFVIERKNRMEALLTRWESYHRRKDLPTLPNEQYLTGAAELAELTEHTPLTAAVTEYLVTQREQRGVLSDDRKELEQGVHPLFEAATLYLDQGAAESNAEAYDLALRRYGRAVGLFSKIHDRTSTAKAYVERARVHIRKGDDPDAVRDDLHTAIGLITAHIKNLPHGVIPEITDDEAIGFLSAKGYQAEADAYVGALAAHSRPE